MIYYDNYVVISILYDVVIIQHFEIILTIIYIVVIFISGILQYFTAVILLTALSLSRHPWQCFTFSEVV